MRALLDRKGFLQAAGVALVAGAGLGRAAIVEGGVPDENPSRSSSPRLFSGCCAYSYRKDLAAGRMTMEDFIRTATALEIDGVDMTGYWFKSTEPSYLSSLRHFAFKNGVGFSGAATGASMVQADAGKRTQVLDDIKKWVDVTESLGAPHLRVFAGKLPQGATPEQGIAWTVETLKPACEYSGKKGITIGFEDHEGITQNADSCLEIIRRVGSPYLGINLDITHFIPTPSADSYAQIEACIPYATHTHIRDVFDNGQPIDLDRIWKLFADGGYKGYMSAEYEGKEDAAIGVPRLLAKIKALCRKYSSV
ncbi:MAG TPA: sugar phosphate isomerase/epimerase family protein [Candidatus Acidoferrum sp.]|nr:sugar phosphate isomerase/epimerase family protein [Candidatus Acidoferrum sp.]